MRRFLVTSSLIALSALPALAAAPQAGDMMVRARVIGIVPDETSSISPIGGSADFSDEVVPELDFTYFFTPNLAVEAIAAIAKHDATARNTGAGTFDAGSAWVLPPTVTLQYHFNDAVDWAKPYVGAGVNYTMYLDEDGGSQQSLKVDSSWGLALQAGVDVPVNDQWSWNFDVKKIFTKANAKWNGGGVSANVDLDPWVIGTGIGYRF